MCAGSASAKDGLKSAQAGRDEPMEETKGSDRAFVDSRPEQGPAGKPAWRETTPEKEGGGKERRGEHPQAELYRQPLGRWSRDMAEFDQKRTEPEQVARVVQKALVARKPRRQYSIGYMSGAAAFLESLPQPLADAILKTRF